MKFVILNMKLGSTGTKKLIDLTKVMGPIHRYQSYKVYTRIEPASYQVELGGQIKRPVTYYEKYFNFSFPLVELTLKQYMFKRSVHFFWVCENPKIWCDHNVVIIETQVVQEHTFYIIFF